MFGLSGTCSTRSAIERRDILGALVILGLATLLAASAYEAIRSAFDRQITVDAQITGQGWVEFISQNLDEIDQIAAGNSVCARPPNAQ